MDSCIDQCEGLHDSELLSFNGNDTPSQSWYCLRTQPKHEHIAAAQLRQQSDVEVFLPRIRYRRPTRCGPAWVTEALFKDYLFARFNLAVALRRVQSSRAVLYVVRFGQGWPTVPPQIITELREAMGGEELREIENSLQPGDVVDIASGAMQGLQALVTRVMPAKQRVAVLLDFLGRQTSVELDQSIVTLAKDEGDRARLPVWERARGTRGAFAQDLRESARAEE